MLICCSSNILIIIKTVVLHNIFVETVMHVIFQDSQMNRKFKKQHLFETEIYCNFNINVTFDNFDDLLNNSVYV